jgi:hypothetical protein
MAAVVVERVWRDDREVPVPNHCRVLRIRCTFVVDSRLQQPSSVYMEVERSGRAVHLWLTAPVTACDIAFVEHLHDLVRAKHHLSQSSWFLTVKNAGSALVYHNQYRIRTCQQQGPVTYKMTLEPCQQRRQWPDGGDAVELELNIYSHPRTGGADAAGVVAAQEIQEATSATLQQLHIQRPHHVWRDDRGETQPPSHARSLRKCCLFRVDSRLSHHFCLCFHSIAAATNGGNNVNWRRLFITTSVAGCRDFNDNNNRWASGMHELVTTNHLAESWLFLEARSTRTGIVDKYRIRTCRRAADPPLFGCYIFMYELTLEPLYELTSDSDFRDGDQVQLLLTIYNRSRAAAAAADDVVGRHTSGFVDDTSSSSSSESAAIMPTRQVVNVTTSPPQLLTSIGFRTFQLSDFQDAAAAAECKEAESANVDVDNDVDDPIQSIIACTVCMSMSDAMMQCHNQHLVCKSCMHKTLTFSNGNIYCCAQCRSHAMAPARLASQLCSASLQRRRL